MAQIKGAGDAVALVSTLKLEELKKLERYDPEALQLVNDKGVATFGVCTGSTGGITQSGITFAGATHDASGFAQHTLMVDDGVTDVKAFAMDKIGPAVLRLGEVEEKAAKALGVINGQLEKVAAAIVIA